MASILTVVPDIYHLIKSKDGWFTDELAKSFSEMVARRLQTHLNEDRGPPRLRLSGMGPKCPCVLWNSIHRPDLAEPLPAHAMIKYSGGHITEALAITLAKAAGHDVKGEQDEIHLDGITGHRDLVLDGCICDVKSCSPFSFEKLVEGKLISDDPFGYLDQLDGYVLGCHDDPLVKVHDRAYILGVHLVLGKLHLYEHRVRQRNIRERIALYKSIVNRSTAPKCECGTRPSGKSGNVELDVRASYSPYKWTCFPQLRAFKYADGVKYLSEVRRTPDVPEIDKFGNPVHH